MLAQNVPVDQIAEVLTLTKALSHLGGEQLIALTTKKDKLILTADAAGVQIKTAIPADIKNSGTVLINIAHLQALWLKAKKVNISAEGKGKIAIKCGRSKYTINATAGEQHNIKIPTPEKDKTVQIPLASLKKAIQYTWFSHEEDGSGDLRIIIDRKKLVTETSDTIKAAICSVPMKLWKNKNPMQAVLKKQAINAIMNSFNLDTDVWLDVTNSNIRVYTDNSLVSIPLIAATELIDVRGMVSSHFKDAKVEFSFRVASAELNDIAKAAAGIANQAAKLKNMRVSLKIDNSRSKMIIETEGDVGSFKTSMEITNFAEGKWCKNTVAVAPKHLRDLASLASKTGEYLDFDVYKQLIVLRSTEETYESTYYFPRYK